jgi:Winged helix-turn helix
MRAGIVVHVTRGDRRRLEAIVADRSAPQKHVWRANIILATADGCGTAEIMRRSGKSKPVVWAWQARFMAEGVEGLTRDKTRKPGKKPLPADTVQRVVDVDPSEHRKRLLSERQAIVEHHGKVLGAENGDDE